MSVNGTLVEQKMRRFKGECACFVFNKYPIYTHDGASAKFSTNSHDDETDDSVDVSSLCPDTDKQLARSIRSMNKSTKSTLSINSKVCRFVFLYFRRLYTAKTQYRNFETIIQRKGIARPQS